MRPRPARRRDAEGEHGGPGDAQSRGKVEAAVPPDDAREAEQQREEPEPEDEDHGGRADERQHAVAHLVGGEPRREQPGGAAQHAGEAPGDARRGDPGHDQHGEDAPDRQADDGDARDERDQAGGLHRAILPDALMLALEAGTSGQVEARRAAGRPRVTRAAGTSTWRERSNSPRPFACASRRRFEATPQPRMPWTTKLTAHRFGRGWRSTANGRASGRSARKRSEVKSSASQRETASSSAQRPTLASPPLSPERAPTSAQRGTWTRSARVTETSPGPVGRAAAPRRVRRGRHHGPGRHRRPAHRARLAVDLEDRRDRRSGHGCRPVPRHTLGPWRRRGEEGARIARQARLDHRTGKGAADRPFVVAAHGEAEIRHAATGEIAREVLRPLGERGPPTGDPGPHGVGGEAGLLRHPGPRERERHRVAPAGVEVRRHLQRRRGRLAPHARDAHPVRSHLGQLDRVEARHGIRAQVAGTGDLVEQLRRHRADRHRPAGAGVLGDDRRTVRVQLGQRETDPVAPGNLLEEGVVPAAALCPALDHVAGHDGARDGVEIAVIPAEGVQRRPHRERGIGDASR